MLGFALTLNLAKKSTRGYIALLALIWTNKQCNNTLFVNIALFALVVTLPRKVPSWVYPRGIPSWVLFLARQTEQNTQKQ
jgi:hypothetical protein